MNSLVCEVGNPYAYSNHDVFFVFFLDGCVCIVRDIDSQLLVVIVHIPLCSCETYGSLLASNCIHLYRKEMAQGNTATRFFPEVLKEAFRRAQLAGRVYPYESDYPAVVPMQEMVGMYLPFIAEEIDRKSHSTECSTYPLGIYTGSLEFGVPRTYHGDDMSNDLFLAEI